MMDIFDAIKQNDIQSIKQIISQDPSILHHKNPDYRSILHIACDHGNVDISKLLIDAGADIHVKDDHGWTPLNGDCYYNYTEIVQLLIDAGANINTKVKGGWTPLHFACSRGQTTIVQLLIGAGVDWLAVNDDNKTPVDLAIFWQSNDVLVFFETISNTLPNSEQKKIQAWRFRLELSKNI